MHVVDDLSTRSRDARERRVAAHAARVRAAVAVADALVVLRGRRAERPTRPVAEREDRHLLRRRPAPRSRCESPSSLRAGRSRGRPPPACGRRTTPFPAASPSALTTQGGRAIGSVGRRAVRPPRPSLPSRTPSSLRSAPPRRPARRRRCRRGGDGRPGPPRAEPRARPRPGRSRSARGEAEESLGILCPHRVAAARAPPSRGCRARNGELSSSGLWAIFHASACSRPPDPTTRTLTRWTLARGFDERPFAHGWP